MNPNICPYCGVEAEDADIEAGYHAAMRPIDSAAGCLFCDPPAFAREEEAA